MIEKWDHEGFVRDCDDAQKRLEEISRHLKYAEWAMYLVGVGLVLMLIGWILRIV